MNEIYYYVSNDCRLKKTILVKLGRGNSHERAKKFV